MPLDDEQTTLSVVRRMLGVANELHVLAWQVHGNIRRRNDALIETIHSVRAEKSTEMTINALSNAIGHLADVIRYVTLHGDAVKVYEQDDSSLIPFEEIEAK